MYSLLSRFLPSYLHTSLSLSCSAFYYLTLILSFLIYFFCLLISLSFLLCFLPFILCLPSPSIFSISCFLLAYLTIRVLCQFQILCRGEQDDKCQHELWFGKELNSVASVRKRTIPTERPPLVGEVSANFLPVEGVAWSAQRIPTAVNLGFLDRKFGKDKDITCHGLMLPGGADYDHTNLFKYSRIPWEYLKKGTSKIRSTEIISARTLDMMCIVHRVVKPVA
jgi:hypothetical protein